MILRKQNKLRTKICIILIMIMIVTTLLSGCGGEVDSSGQAIGDVAVQAYGSTLTMEWDPAVMYSDSVAVMSNVYETLLRYNPKEDKIVPCLATEYSKTDDGLTWTFKIREGVKFHDGTDLTAEDVKYSIDRTMEIGNGAAFIWGPVEEIKVIDEYTVEMSVKYPAPMDLISASNYAAYIHSKDAAEADPEGWYMDKEAGSGPYIIESSVQGDQVVLSKFDDYWKGWEGKHFEKVVIKSILEGATRRQMFEAGELDAGGVNLEDLPIIRQNPNLSVVEVPTFVNTAAYFNTDKAPLDNKLVRQALSYAFPYEDVIEYVMNGYAEQTRGVLPANMWGYSEDIPQYTYDLDKAKELLDQAGYPDGGFKLVYTYINGPEDMKKTAELYKTELAKIGVELELRAMPWDSEWAMAKAENPEDRQDICSFRWWPDVCSPDSWLQSLYHSEDQIIFNLCYYENDDVDQFIEEGIRLSGIDRNQAAEKFVEAQKQIMEDAVVIPQYDHAGIWVLNSSVKGFEFNPAYNACVSWYDCYREE